MTTDNLAAALLGIRSTIPSKSRPTVEQIAMIAATLAVNAINETPEALADKAMKQWLAARARIYIADKELEFSKQDIELELKFFQWPAEEDCFLPTDEYPVKRDKFLQRMLPKDKSRPDVLKRRGTDFISYVLRDILKRVPTPKEVAKAYAEWPSCKNAKRANEVVKHFKEWRGKQISEARHNAGMKSAQKRAKIRRKARPPREKLKNILLT